MEARQLLDLFIGGDLHHENTCKVEVNEYTNLKWLIGAVNAQRIPHGDYIVYYEPILTWDDKVKVKPDYTLKDIDNNNIYLLKID